MTQPNTPRNGEPQTRYPETLTLVRHAESAYNSLKKKSGNWESARAFKAVFDAEYYDDPAAKTLKPDLDIAVLEGQWPSPELRALALTFYKDIRGVMQGVSDFDTPITDRGWRQARDTGKTIGDIVPEPDIIYVSPYLRTRQTLAAILEGAPDAWKMAQQWPHENLREQEHGIQTVFNDWRLGFVFEPMEMVHYNRQGPYSYRYKGGESKFDVRSRTSDFIGRLRRKHEGENVLVVTHHLTILSTLAELMHWTREDFLQWDEERKPANCGVTLFRREHAASRTGRDLLRLKDEEYSMKFYT